MSKKTIPIGYEDLREIVNKDMYYVDKTFVLKSFIDNHSKVTLFTRPRRFGKTLNQSMFRRFFEDERKSDGSRIDNGYIFDGLVISACGDKYLQHQQQYPVINLSLKSGKQPNFALAYEMLKKEIIREFERHSYVLKCSALEKQEREAFQAVLNAEAKEELYADGLKTLSGCLEKYHGRKCIILIDEYDVPLENAWFAGFYDEMTSFIRSLFESALKTNDALEFAVITGCLRISRESIFTGLNNLQMNSVTGTGYGDAFGFTEKEVFDMLTYYGLAEHFEGIKQWYDGYLFDEKEIYNPWSIINYVHDLTIRPTSFPKAYWSNTSSNSIIRELVERADKETREEIEQLIAGETLEKPVHEDITYGDIHESKDNLWNFLYFTGYLKSCGQRYDGETTFVKLAIPNTEIRTIYKNTVRIWFDKKLERTDQTPLLKALEEGNCDAIEDLLSGQLLDAISFYDYKESYYHGFLTGMLKTAAKEYSVLSNRESGNGRPDLILKTSRIRKGRAFIIEVKVADTFSGMEDCCGKALAQIEDRNYAAALREEGYQDIESYGICFYQKECMVVKAAAKTPREQSGK